MNTVHVPLQHLNTRLWRAYGHPRTVLSFMAVARGRVPASRTASLAGDRMPPLAELVCCRGRPAWLSAGDCAPVTGLPHK